MRAVQITSLDGPTAVTVSDVGDPTPGPDQILVRVRAAGVAFPDLLQTRGLYQMRPDLPYIPGAEAAGIVRSAPGGSAFAEGDRVMTFGMVGAMAELVVAEQATTFALPDQLTFVQGAAFPMNYHTAWFSLVRRGRMESGETILVHGAAGGVGTATIQVAKALGGRVFAVVSSDEKAQVASDAGADEVLRSDGSWKDEARSLTDGRGVDLVMDPVGGDRFTDSLRSLARGGRLLVVGFAAGSIPEVKVNRLLLSNTAVVGCALGEAFMGDSGVLGEMAAAMDPLIRDGSLVPPVGAEMPLDKASEALTLLDNRLATGKVVLTIEG